MIGVNLHVRMGLYTEREDGGAYKKYGDNGDKFS